MIKIVLLTVLILVVFIGGTAIGMLCGMKLEENEHYIKLKKINISDNFKKHPPKRKKFCQRASYFRDFGRFYSPIILDDDNYLIDGYTSYLIAKQNGIKRVEFTRR